MNLSKKAFKIVFTLKIIILIISFASTAYAELKLDSVYPTLGELGKDLEVTLTGSGFDVNTRVSVHLDSGNKRQIIGAVDTPGYSYDVTVVGTTAYVADYENGLQVIDVSDPANPQIVGFVVTPDKARHVTVVDTTAYVADSASGLLVIDVSDPGSPHIIDTVDTPGFAYAVTVVDTTAYVADATGGLQVIDISDPENRYIVGSVDTPGYAFGVTVVGTTVYVADAQGGLQVIDVSDPENRHIVGSVDTSGNAWDVTVVGTTAYVAAYGGGLQVIDVGTPENPEVIGSVVTPGAALGVIVIDTKAYVADWISGLQVIDVSNPQSPQVIGSVNTPGYAFDVTVIGTRAYVADYGSGLQVIDVSNPVSPKTFGSVDTPGSAYGVTLVGTTAYVADATEGLQVIDVSDPQNPHIIGSVDTPGSAWGGVEVVGTTAYVADQNSGLQVIDVNDPQNPHIIGDVDTSGSALHLTVVGTTVYVADNKGGLQVIDVSDLKKPENWHIIGSVDTSVDASVDPPASAYGVAVVGTTAYVADFLSGLQVIDVSDLSNPENWHIMGTVDTPGNAWGVTVVGTTAYVSDWDAGLQVIDVSDPENPLIIGAVDTPGAARGITVIGPTAYVADIGVIHAIDVSNPESPLIIGSVDTPGAARGFAILGDMACVADANAFVIVPIPQEIESVAVNSSTSISATIASPIMAGHYTLMVFNETESDGLAGAVSFTTDLQIFNSKAIIVAGGGPSAPGEIWEETKQSANKAYDVLIYEGYTDESIYYLSGEFGNPVRDGSSRRDELEWAINTWAVNASELVIFFVDHGGQDNFIIYDDGQDSEKLYVDELDNWLDNLQQNMVGPITFIYDACQSGTFASKLVPPIGKDRIIITGASDEPAYFPSEVSFSFQFWEQIYLWDGNLGEAFSRAAETMRGYQTALLNANGNSLTNEAEDIATANGIVIHRGAPIYIKPAPAIDNVCAGQTLTDSTSADIWVSGVREAESVWAKIIPPDINPEADGIPITALDAIELYDYDADGVYEGTYDAFTKKGTYTIIANAQTSQEIYSYVQGAMVTQIITSSPGSTSVTQLNGADNISADDYEEDDSYPQASVITLNDLDVQPHNFHDLGDADWVKFYALSGQTYTIKASNVSVVCDVVIELFDSNGITRLVGPWNEGGDGEDEIIEWTCTRDDIYYVKLSNANATFGENCKYDLKLYRPIGPLTGFVSGLVKDMITQQTLADVQIKTDLAQTTLSLPNGSYLMVHPAGPSFLVTAEKTGYNSKDISGVAITEGGLTALDITLMRADTDGDGISDIVETASACLDADDADTDDDCIPDGVEDENHNGALDFNETDPCDADTDGDGIQDGTELGYTLSDANPDTNPSLFQPDLDPSTATDPIDDDSDNDGLLDGQEDANHNGRVDSGETNPTISDLAELNAMPWIPLLLLNE